MYKKIAIIGVGLIGGSIGLAAKERKLAREVVGICRRESSRRRAEEKGAVDWATCDLTKGLAGADFIIIATPVGIAVETAEKVCKNVTWDSILIDVGSTKEMVVKKIDEMVPRNIDFVGTHPMAGSEKSGVSSAEAKLFDESICIITKTRRTKPGAVRKVKKFWESLGAGCIVMTPESHDKHIASISHLPHLVAFTLLRAVKPESLRYAANGFKDTTRIGASDPLMWHDIFMSNKKALLMAVGSYKKALASLERTIRKGYSKRLVDILTASKAIRDTFTDKKKR